MSNAYKALSCLVAVLTLFANTIFAQLPDYVPTSGLIAYYGFNGNGSDLSGNGNTGTVSGPTYVTDRYGNSNAALNFTGTAERVTTHKIDRTTTNSFSYSVWIKTTYTGSIPSQGGGGGLSSTESNSCVIAPVNGWNWSTTGTDVAAGLYVAANGIYVTEHGPGITNVALAWTGTLSSGWHHVVIVYSSQLPSLYVDGGFIQNGVTSTKVVHPSIACDSFNSPSLPYITAGFGHGLYPVTVPTYNFTGNIDDIAIYNRALTQCEISQLYDTTVTTIPITGPSTVCAGSPTTYTTTATGGKWYSGITSIATIDSVSGILTGLSGGITNVTYLLPSGCKSSTPVTVDTIPLITGTATVCPGTNTTLSYITGGGSWTSSNPGVATVGTSSGIVTGVAAGTTVISYAVTLACGIAYAKKTVTVNPSPSLITAPPACVGISATFSDTLTGGTWISSSPSVASVGSSSGIVTGGTTGTTTITYSLPTGCSISKTITVNSLPAGITGALNVCTGLTTILNDATTGGTWSSSNTAKATVSAGTGAGTVTGIAVGVPLITYTLANGCYTTAVVTVYPLPAAITGSSSICMGQTTTLSDPTGGGTWSSGNPAAATVGSGTGIVSAVATGTATIVYSLAAGCNSSFSVTVNPLPSVITGTTNVCVTATTLLNDTTVGGFWSTSDPFTADINPATGIVTGVVAGTATITYTSSANCISTTVVTVNPAPGAINGDSLVCVAGIIPLYDGGGGTWSSSSPASGSIDAVSGVVTGVSSGFTVISYTLPTGCSALQPVTVNPLPLAISGSTGICVGLNTTLVDLSPLGTWTSSNPSAATIIAPSGIMTGVAPGTTTITYTLPTGCAVTSNVTVNSSPGVITGVPHVCIGSSTTLGDPVGGGTWSSSAPTIATVVPTSGLVTSVITGTTLITYSLGAGCSATVVVTVNPLPGAILGAPTVCPAATTTLTDGGGGTWTSGNIAAATIGSSSGIVTGVATGISTIVYTLGTGCTKSIVVTVNPLPSVIGGPTQVCAGSAMTVTDPSVGGTWSSSPAPIATIGTSSGIVSGVLAGPATITYTIGTGCKRTEAITVNPLPSTISGPSSVCAGSTITLTDAGGGTWSTASTTATVGISSGIVTGVSSGPATITYTISTGCYVTKTITVNPLPVPISGPSAVCAGATITLTDPGGGIWFSSVPTTASIGTSSGIVSGVATGTTTISYTLPTGCTTIMAVTVSSAPVAIVGSPTVCAGATTTLTDPVAGGAWSSSVPTSATVGSLSGIVSGVTTGATTTISYSLGTGCTVTKTMTVIASPSPVRGTTTVCAGSTTALSDPTTGGTWSSSLIATATVGSTGIVSGMAAGIAAISYTVAGCPAIAVVTVNTAPASIAGPSSVCAGSLVTESDLVPGGTWSSTSALIRVNSTSGDVTGITAGTPNITYSIGGCFITRPITVNPIGAITGATGICTGTTSTLTDAGAGTWTSAVPTVATITPTTGIVTGIGPGTSMITYTLGTGCSATTIVTVSSAPSAITGILHACAGGTTALSDLAGGGTWSVTPAITASIGSSTGIVTGIAPGFAAVIYSLGSGCTATTTVNVTASPSGISGASQVCSGSAITLTDPTPGGLWSSSTANATVTGGGIVSGVSAGVATISYTSAGCSALQAITVNPLPAAISGTGGICSGLTMNLSDDTTGGSWSTSSPITALVGTASGMVTAGSAGSATISYTLPTGCSATTTVTVHANPPAISGTSMVCIGFTAPLTDAASGGVWSSDNIPAVSIDASTGIISGIGLGSATISYTLGGCMATKIVSVNSLPGSITGGPAVCLSATRTFADITPGGTWSTSNPAVVTADPATGAVTGVSAGLATITYSLGPGCNVTAPVTVNPLPAVITGAAHLCVGTTAALTETTTGGTWSSTNPTITTVTTGGVVSGVAYGVDTILYTLPATGCSARYPVNVINVPPISMPASICAWGDTVSISDGYPGGLFSSTSVTVVNTGSEHGVVTAHAPGSATITYTVPAGCSITATLTVNPLPGPILSIDNRICSGLTGALSDATPGGTWTSSTAAVATVDVITGVVTGVATGTAMVTYTLPTGCETDTTVAVVAPPSAVSGGSAICTGATTVLSDIVPGGTWSSSDPAVATVSATGMISAITSGAVTITYTMGASCAATKAVTVNPLPVVFITTGGGSYCADGSGIAVWLSGSETGVNYQLYNGTALAGPAMPGTGSSIDFGTETAPGSYTTIATDPSTSCQATMAGTASVTINPLPAPYTATGGGAYCAGGTGAPISLSGSSSGIIYQPYYYFTLVPSGSAVAGTGTALSFGPRAGAGTYVVIAKDPVTSCTSQMPGLVTISITPVVIPSVTVTAITSDTLCAGTMASFTTSIGNGGTSPVYQWTVNGISTGAGGSAYNYVPANGDIVSVQLTSNAACAEPASIMSNSVTLTVDPLLLPVVTVTANPGTVTTKGQPVTFTAAAMNAGASPTYQWTINDVAIIGANTSTFTSDTLTTGDIVKCIVTSVGQCGGATGNNFVTMTVNSNVGVNTLSTKTDIKVLPNPNNGAFTVSGTIANGTDEDVTFLVTDMLGKEVYTGSVVAKGGKLNEHISVGKAVANGMYLLSVRSASGNEVFHIVIRQ